MTTDSRSRPAITTYTWDVLLSGGLSILFLVPLSAIGNSFTEGVLTKDFLLLSIFINYPHFLLSYRLIYRGPESIVKHPWATVYIPACLIFAVLFATFVSPWNSVPVLLMAFVGQFYLAWHYTGQAFGMVSAFAILDGFRFSPLERKLLLLNVRVLLVWHISWLLEREGDLPPWLSTTFDLLYQTVSFAAAFSMLLGLASFYLCWKRSGRAPTLRMIVPWLALYIWYATLARYSAAIFWIQIFHAIQYISFPLRVEGNRRAKRDRLGEEGNLRGPIKRQLFFYFCALIIFTVVFFSLGLKAVADFLDGVFTPFFFTDWVGPLAIGGIFVKAFLAAFNVHHYVIDGVAWKLKDASVKRELFSHIPKNN
jgi:hypothetical protein